MAGARGETSKGVIGGLLAVVAIGAIVFATRSPSPSTSPADLPLAPPSEPETSTSLPLPRPVVESARWRLGVQATDVLWEIDQTTGETRRLIEPAGDSVPRGDAVVVMRLGTGGSASVGSTPAVIGTQGDIVLIESDGEEHAFGVRLPSQRAGQPVGTNPRFALTPRPVALVPVWAEPVTMLRRVALDGTDYADIQLPACVEAVPFAAMSTDRVFGVWCGDSDELRLFYDEPGEPIEVTVADVNADGLPVALLARGDKPILIDPFGGVWEMVLSPSLFEDPALLIDGDEDAIPLENDERVLGIAALSNDFQHLLVGVSSSSDFDGGATASRLVAIDLFGFAEGWSVATPVPLVSMVGAPDGLVYGIGTDGDGGVLIVIDPATGASNVLLRGLPIDEGRLMVLG